MTLFFPYFLYFFSVYFHIIYFILFYYFFFLGVDLPTYNLSHTHTYCFYFFFHSLCFKFIHVKILLWFVVLVFVSEEGVKRNLTFKMFLGFFSFDLYTSRSVISKHLSLDAQFFLLGIDYFP